jgi:predicted transcriptional regulator
MLTGRIMPNNGMRGEMMGGEMSTSNTKLAGNRERSADARTRTLLLHMDNTQRERSIEVAKALGSAQRVRILDYLQARVANVSEIAEALEMPLSTANLHLTGLEEAGLIRSEIVAASRGVQKVCARAYDVIMIQLPRTFASHDRKFSVQMPVGAFAACQVQPTCGIATEKGVIGFLDDPVSFYEPTRFQAQLLWFRQGFLEYHFPYRPEPNQQPRSLVLSMEICSEAPNHHHDWPSDIFLEINGRQVGIWTSPADFGGERGNLSPEWWEEWNSQYGLMKSWRVDGEGSWIDGVRISDVTIGDLVLDQDFYIRVRIGVHPDAVHVGGINLFGSKFGNYPQDILLQVHY